MGNDQGQLSIRYMAGNCSHGGAKTGIRWHAVPGAVGNGARPKALCGRQPSIQWSDAQPERAVSCPGCLKALKKRYQPLKKTFTVVAYAEFYVHVDAGSEEEAIAISRQRNLQGELTADWRRTMNSPLAGHKIAPEGE